MMEVRASIPQQYNAHQGLRYAGPRASSSSAYQTAGCCCRPISIILLTWRKCEAISVTVITQAVRYPDTVRNVTLECTVDSTGSRPLGPQFKLNPGKSASSCGYGIALSRDVGESTR